MFKCEICGSTVEPNTRLQRVVTKQRKVEYTSGFFGSEIVEEKRACTPCALSVTTNGPTIVEGTAKRYAP